MNNKLLRLLQRSFSSESSIRPRRSPGFIRVPDTAPDAVGYTSSSVDSITEQPVFGTRSVFPIPREADGTPARTPTSAVPDQVRAPSPSRQPAQAETATKGSEAQDSTEQQDDAGSAPREQQQPAERITVSTEAGSLTRAADSGEDRSEHRIATTAASRRADRNENVNHQELERSDVEPRGLDPMVENSLAPPLRPAAVQETPLNSHVSVNEVDSPEHVQVTIGRVEIRFPDTRTAAEPQETEPRMTLDDYLERQSKRRR